MYTPLTKQTSFSNLESQLLDKSRTARFLERVNALIDWPRVERQLMGLYCADNGRPGHNPLGLFKALLLEQWYQLSDAKAEEELKDRLSFRQFIGLRGGENPPDETTLVRFRAKLRTHHLAATLFTLIRDQLRANHTEVRQGKVLLADATLVEAPYGTQPKGRDNNGDFVRRGKLLTKGYKAHLFRNQRDGLIETGLLTVASCHESRFLEDALQQVSGPVTAVIADKGYASSERKRLFRQRGIYYGVLEKRWRHQGRLSQKQQQKNRRLIPIRAKVERPFAVLKQAFGWVRVRYFGLARNASHLWQLCLAFNLQLMANRVA